MNTSLTKPSVLSAVEVRRGSLVHREFNEIDTAAARVAAIWEPDDPALSAFSAR